MTARAERHAVLFLGEAAQRLRCSPVTIRRRLRDGTFPVAPIPSIDWKIRFPAADIEALAAGRFGGVSLLRRRAS